MTTYLNNIRKVVQAYFISATTTKTRCRVIQFNDTNSLPSSQKNHERPASTLETLWMPAGRATTINWGLRSPTIVTMATRRLAGTPLPVWWGMMGSQCGTRLFLRVKVGEAHELQPDSNGAHVTGGYILLTHTAVMPAFLSNNPTAVRSNPQLWC